MKKLRAVLLWGLAAVTVFLAVRWLVKKMRSVERDPTTLEVLEALCSDFNVPVNLAKAIIKKESAWDPNAFNPKGAGNALNGYGLMQISEMVAQDDGLVTDWRNPTQEEKDKLFVPYYNIHAGLHYFSKLYNSYPLEAAVQMYNLGEDGYNVHGWRNAGYLADVLNNFNEYEAVNA